MRRVAGSVSVLSTPLSTVRCVKLRERARVDKNVGIDYTDIPGITDPYRAILQTKFLLNPVLARAAHNTTA